MGLGHRYLQAAVLPPGQCGRSPPSMPSFGMLGSVMIPAPRPQHRYRPPPASSSSSSSAVWSYTRITAAHDAFLTRVLSGAFLHDPDRLSLHPAHHGPCAEVCGLHHHLHWRCRERGETPPSHRGCRRGCRLCPPSLAEPGQGPPAVFLEVSAAIQSDEMCLLIGMVVAACGSGDGGGECGGGGSGGGCGGGCGGPASLLIRVNGNDFSSQL